MPVFAEVDVVVVGVRQTRSIVGVERLGNLDVTSRRKRADGIARSPRPIELHVAAGLAAAVAVARQRPVRTIAGVELRQLLNADGARLDD